MHRIHNTMLRLTSGLRCRSLDHRFRSFTSFKILRNEEQSKIIPPNPLVELKKLKLKIPRANKMPSRPTLPESDIQEKFIKGGSGKGGQKINKTNSKVQLTHIPTGIVVTSQATRSRDQNRKIAREILALKIDEMENGVQSRKGIVIARKQMQKQRAKKKTKAKYKKLADVAKQESDAAKDDDDNNDDDNNDDDNNDDVIVIVDEETIVNTNQKN